MFYPPEFLSTPVADLTDGTTFTLQDLINAFSEVMDGVGSSEQDIENVTGCSPEQCAFINRVRNAVHCQWQF